LRLGTIPTLVQCIKFCEQLATRIDLSKFNFD